MSKTRKDPLTPTSAEVPEGKKNRPWRRRRVSGVRINPRDANKPLFNSLYIFPNLFTSASLFLALYSITKAAEGIAATPEVARECFIASCWAILLAAVCDAIDGPVARLTRTASSFGLQYDSLADVVAFGVAPAFLMFCNLNRIDGGQLAPYAPKLALGACSLYAICAAIRLARFNIQAHTTEKRYFSGLPSPGAAGAAVTAYLFVEWFSALAFVRDFEDPYKLARTLHRCIMILMVGLALLMVSEVPFPKLRNMVPKGKPINTLIAVIIIVCLVIAFNFYMPVFLFGGFLLYLISAVYTGTRNKIRKKPEEVPAEA